MVSTEISLNFANDENSLETRLEEVNPSYKRARELYNALLKKTLNPLLNNGLSGDKSSFVIILLEKILRNTDILFDQNTNLKHKVDILEQNIIQLKQEGLDPVIQAGNRITTELKLFEIGFQSWNTKFDTFLGIFETWDSGFKDFETNFAALNKFLKEFTEDWIEKTGTIQNNLHRIERHITQWNDEIISVNNRLALLEKSYISFEQRQQHLTTPRPLRITDTGRSKSPIYRTLPSNNHQWRL